jgi:hypothetical protein
MEVYQHDIQRLIDLAPELLREHETEEALRLWLAEVARILELIIDGLLARRHPFR